MSAIPGVKWFALAAIVTGALAAGLAQVFPADGGLIGVVAAGVATLLAGVTKWLQDRAKPSPLQPPPGAQGMVRDTYVPARSKFDVWWNGR